jgi:carbon storage regulator
MLVLSRKKNESIIIEPDIEIEVVAVGRNQIKLGITAPRDVSIYRKELIGSSDNRPGQHAVLRNINLHGSKRRCFKENMEELYACKR